MIRHILPAFLVCGACLLLPSWGQDPPGDPNAASDEPVTVPDALSQEQHQIADKYRRLEDLIFKMADFEATSNPRRAALLRQAYKQSKDRLTQSQLNSITALLAQQQYKRALDGQEVARKDLQDLLQLLLSEDRSDRLKSETQKIKEHIKELKRLERLQRSVRGRTEGGSDTQELAKDQGQIADRTDDLAKELEQADAEKADSSGSDAADAPSQSDPGDGGQPRGDAGEAPDEAKPADPAADAPPTGDPSESSPDGESSKSPPGKPAPSPPGDPGVEPAEPGGEPSDAPPGETPAQPTPGDEPGGEPGDEPSGEPGAPPSAPQAPPDDDGPAKKRVREAEQKMREAERNLEEARRSESVENQTEALRKLQEAIAELEEVLRQLREEEMARVLALLEGRFRRMLEAQLKVYEGTLQIDKIPSDQRGRAVDIRANRLAYDQRKIAGDADRCLTLLLEEGSSVAFPHVVEQMRDDMEEVAARLDLTKVDLITQGLEEEIISTLEELLEALQQAQQDLQDSPPPPPGQADMAGEQALVDILAELKMIRALQVRVNSRTDRFARLLDDNQDPVGQALTDDLRNAIGKLGEREASIQRITRDIVLGKNR